MNHKVAVVTGASRGIGRGCAIGLAELGYQVVLSARTAEALEAVCEEITELEASPEPIVYPLDVTHDGSVAEFAQALSKRFDCIDVFVNNAGIDARGSLELPVSDFDRLLDTNLRAPFILLQSLLPQLQRANQPYVFNVASRAGKFGFAGNGGYVASKFGLVGLNESLYREFADAKLRVTALCPGWVNTDMAAAGGAPLAPEAMIQVSDIVSTLRWLLSLSAQTCVREVVLECKGSIA